MEIVEALNKLDPSDDSQWTSEGLPKLDTVRQLVDNSSLIRKDITEAAPEFGRASRSFLQLPGKVDSVVDKPPEELADKSLDPIDCEYTPLDRKKEIDERINDLNQQKGVIELEVDVLLREQTRLQTSQFQDNSAAADTKARLYYIAQQNKIHVEKAERARAFLESGAKVADINPKSALDQSFALDRKRGTARPVRALKTE